MVKEGVNFYKNTSCLSLLLVNSNNYYFFGLCGQFTFVKAVAFVKMDGFVESHAQSTKQQPNCYCFVNYYFVHLESYG